MCYDISFKSKVGDLSDYFPDIVFDDQIEIDFDQSAHIQGPGIYPEVGVMNRNREDNRIHYHLGEWGVIPFYFTSEEKAKKIRNGMMNARSEEVFNKDKYWNKIRHRRCIVPVTAIYEHRHIKGWKNAVPYKVQLKERPIFGLPAFYSVANIENKDGVVKKHWTWANLTTDANEIMRKIHNGGKNPFRMPLFLPKELEEAWLSDLNDTQLQEILKYSIRSNAIDHCTVFTIRGGKLRPDGKSKDETFEWVGLPDFDVENAA